CKSSGRERELDVARLWNAAYASRNGKSVAESDAPAETWLRSSPDAGSVPSRDGHGCSDVQRNPLPVKRLVVIANRNVPGAPDPACERRKRPVEPNFVFWMVSERARASTSSDSSPSSADAGSGSRPSTSSVPSVTPPSAVAAPSAVPGAVPG